MIGLKRGIVKLMPHHKQWAVVFAHEKKRLLSRVGHLVVSVEHIGSTAIPGLDAKPIIDMLAGVTRLKDAAKLIKPLNKMGYHFYRKSGRQFFFAKGPDSRRTHYLHIRKYNGAKWKTDLLFRAFLLNHPKRAKMYATLKRNLARQYPNNREKYTAGKGVFIRKIIALSKTTLGRSRT